jgi:hypothetical protein
LGFEECFRQSDHMQNMVFIMLGHADDSPGTIAIDDTDQVWIAPSHIDLEPDGFCDLLAHLR